MCQESTFQVPETSQTPTYIIKACSSEMAIKEVQGAQGAEGCLLRPRPLFGGENV